jgi:hypothetical protein
MNNSVKQQSGLSLSELLISLFLASIISSVLIQFYLSSKSEYRKTQKILSQVLDVHWVIDLLSDSIRRAGFTPCLSLDQLIVKDQRTNKAVIQALKIENTPRQLIQISRMHEYFSQVKHATANQIWASNTYSFNEKHPVLISDCEHAEIHNVLNIKQFSRSILITLEKPLAYSYTNSAYVGEFIEEQWFIHEESLFYRLSHTEEISSLIHSLSVYQQKVHDRLLIEVTMGLEDKTVRQFKVVVRG